MIVKVFVVFALLLALCVPVSVTLGITSLLPKLLNPSFPANAQFLVRQIVGGVDSTPILALPLFVLSGIIMARGEISAKLFNMFAFLIGRRKGALPCVVVLTCLFYGAISGSAPATTAAVGAMTIPLLIELGYDKVFVTSLVAVSGGLGVIIPPSIPFILYGLAASESVGKLFIAGVIPGALIGACLMIYAWRHCKVHGEDEEKLDAYLAKLRSKGFFGLLRESLGALMTPIIILGGIYGGVVTPTEAACVSVFYALAICCFLDRTLSFRDVVGIFREAVNTYGPILFILGTATACGRVLAMLQAPQTVAAGIMSVVSGKIAVLLVVNGFLLIVGMLMDTGPAILILTPILLPLMKSVGVNPVHFGVIMVVNLAIGFVTPPVGINLYVASSMTKIPVLTIARGALPFIAAFFAALMLITFIPAMSLLLQ
ncbi:MAG: TRAP transporter large permease [Synergistaceae bacterium]|jgi:C4-dicarboxylate transporter DctM subunit|nr:TRAP transporter large permease [Synergistaceae bacterium]